MAFGLTGVPIGFIVAAANGIILFGAHTILVGIFKTFLGLCNFAARGYY
jgi:hypothetical protein